MRCAYCALRRLEPEPMVDTPPSRPTRHYSKRHRRPGHVHRPAVRHRKLDHESHYQEPARSQSGRQAENEEGGKENFGGADEECGSLRRWKRVWPAGQMQLKLRAATEDCHIVQFEEAAP